MSNEFKNSDIEKLTSNMTTTYNSSVLAPHTRDDKSSIGLEASPSAVIEMSHRLKGQSFYGCFGFMLHSAGKKPIETYYRM